MTLRFVFLVMALAGFGGGCGPRDAREVPKPPLRVQLRITGTGLSGVKSTIISKNNKHQIVMYGDPSQNVTFVRRDTVSALFAIGKYDPQGVFDTASIGRQERLAFEVQVAKNQFTGPGKKGDKPVFKVDLVVEGEVVTSVQVPRKGAGKGAGQDSTALLAFDTKQFN